VAAIADGLCDRDPAGDCGDVQVTLTQRL